MQKKKTEKENAKQYAGESAEYTRRERIYIGLSSLAELAAQVKKFTHTKARESQMYASYASVLMCVSWTDANSSAEKNRPYMYLSFSFLPRFFLLSFSLEPRKKIPASCTPQQ